MQAMTVVSIQDKNLKGFKLGDLTPLKIQSSHYSPSGTYTLYMWGKKMVSKLSAQVTLVFSVYPITSKLNHRLLVRGISHMFLRGRFEG